MAAAPCQQPRKPSRQYNCIFSLSRHIFPIIKCNYKPIKTLLILVLYMYMCINLTQPLRQLENKYLPRQRKLWRRCNNETRGTSPAYHQTNVASWDRIHVTSVRCRVYLWGRILISVHKHHWDNQKLNIRVILLNFRLKLFTKRVKYSAN